jgi:hypothetical protein
MPDLFDTDFNVMSQIKLEQIVYRLLDGKATVLRQGCRNRAYMDVLAACRRPSSRR